MKMGLETNELYFVYGIDKYGNVIEEKRLTDKEHFSRCVRETKYDLGINKVQANKASMCFAGYFVQGDWIGEF